MAVESGGSTPFHIGFATTERQDMMKMAMRLLQVLLMMTALLSTASCNNSSPTSPGHAPTISHLQVHSERRVSGSEGLVSFSFDYADPDADIARVVIEFDGNGVVVRTLDDTKQTDGTETLIQPVTLPAAGAKVNFSVQVIDQRGNASNSLSASFVAP
jgi:hypothetical protein